MRKILFLQSWFKVFGYQLKIVPFSYLYLKIVYINLVLNFDIFVSCTYEVGNYK